MPLPIPVELLPHDSAWMETAKWEAARLSEALGGNLSTVEHIGSTAIPMIRAKPILDLMPIVTSLTALDEARPRIEALGYAWWGEYGLPERRHCTLDDQATGHRRVQLHCY
ncbi:MAG: hypothetical protein QOF01_2006 [Thermomicrobiales bacterium]|jgi:GrpB-like predicted nucleotidyltransferase (UPF0157 family)|nr:hypothetical protein [Thermomicrobiales bacterium]